MEDERGWLHIANALILRDFHLDPETLTDNEWVHHTKMATYLEFRHLQQLQPLLTPRI